MASEVNGLPVIIVQFKIGNFTLKTVKTKRKSRIHLTHVSVCIDFSWPILLIKHLKLG